MEQHVYGVGFLINGGEWRDPDGRPLRMIVTAANAQDAEKTAFAAWLGHRPDDCDQRYRDTVCKATELPNGWASGLIVPFF